MAESIFNSLSLLSEELQKETRDISNRKLDVAIFNQFVNKSGVLFIDEIQIDETEKKTGKKMNFKHYTTDLNDTLSLIQHRLPGWEWLIRTSTEGPNKFFCNMWLEGTHPNSGGPHGPAHGETPSIAMIRSFLRIMATLKKIPSKKDDEQN